MKQRGEAKSRQLFRASSVMRNCYFTLELSDEIWGPDALSYDDVQKLVFKYKYVLCYICIFKKTAARIACVGEMLFMVDS